mgnify:CR=1 FL=1
MKKNIETYTITAALPYANGPIHIGHLAGVYIPADIYARYKRLTKNDVAFICGSDEHGVAISLASKKASISPKELIDKYDKMIKSSFEEFGISFDNYSRTSKKIHHETSIELFNLLKDKGLFSLIQSEQFFDVNENQFLADRYITGDCPICNSEGAYGDQCEKCGATLSPDELVNPRSAISDSKPILKQTKHYYIKLDEFEEFIREWITVENKEKWKTNVVGQVKSWLDSGLKPRAVTRDLDWGIPVKVDDENGKVLYVWFEAPIGYISSTKEWAENNNKDWKKYWKNSKTNLIHFIGKDNIVFHCIIFPIMLKMFGDYVLPKNVPANEFLNLEGQKISTSRNWAVWLHEYLIDFPNQQDVLRYVLTANAPESKDNDFTWKEFQARNNNELVAIYGNFINRVVVLTHKYYDGKVPSPGELNNEDQIVLDSVVNFQKKISDKIESFKFRESIKELINLARLGNKYLADHEPWKLIKTSPERVNSIIYVSLQLVAHIAYLSEPFLPFTSHKLLKILNLKKSKWNILRKESILMEGHTINQQELLFSKIEDSQINQQLNKLNNYKNTNDLDLISKPKPSVDYDIFQSLDIKVGEIINAERIPKTKNILKLRVSINDKNLIIVSGIANDYDLKEILGQKVTVLVNLKPKKIKGVESQGMILMGKGVSGKNIFISPDQKSVSNGSKIY